MKLLSRLIVVILVLVSGVYSGLWYLACHWIDSHLLPRQEVRFSFGSALKGAEGSFTLDVGTVSYSGFLQGKALVVAEIKGVSSQSTMPSTGKGQPARVIKSKFESGTNPIVYSLSAPLFGNSFRIESAEFKDLPIEQGLLSGESSKMLVSTTPTALDIGFSRSAFLFQRSKLLEQIRQEPLVALREFSGFRIKPAHIVQKIAENGAVIAEGDCTGGGIRWRSSGKPGSVSVEYDLGLDLKYGPGFASVIASNVQASIPDPSVSAVASSVGSAFGALMQGARLLTKGSIVAEFDGAAEGLQSSVVPFSIRFNDFHFQVPLPLASEEVVDGAVEFQRGAGKPLAVTLAIKRQPNLDTAAVSRFIDAIKDLPDVKTLGLDMTQPLLAQLSSFAELEGSKGAALMVIAAAKAWSEKVQTLPASLDLDLSVVSTSGQADMLELLAAESRVNFKSRLGADIGLDIIGQSKGVNEWSGELHLIKLLDLIKALKDPVRIFVARSFIATFFNEPSAPQVGGGSDSAAAQNERTLVEHAFSDGVFDELLNTVDRMLKIIDQTPDTPEEVTVKVSGVRNEVSIGGKPLAEYASEVQPALKKEIEDLGQRFQKDFAMPAPSPSAAGADDTLLQGHEMAA